MVISPRTSGRTTMRGRDPPSDSMTAIESTIVNKVFRTGTNKISHCFLIYNILGSLILNELYHFYRDTRDTGGCVWDLNLKRRLIGYHLTY